MKRKRLNSSEKGTPLRRSTRLWKTHFEASRVEKLCNYCKLIKIQDLPSDESLYRRTLKEACQSADEGCTFCHFLNQGFANLGDYAQKDPNAVWSLSIRQREEAYGVNRRPTRVKPRERSEGQYMSYIAIKAKRTLAARALNPPSSYRAPSWSWASINGPVEINDNFFYFAKRGASAGMQYEVKHWETEYGPRLVACALHHSHESPYLNVFEGSFIQVEGYCRPLWVSKTKLSSKAIGPQGRFVKDLIFDYDQPDELYCYLSKPRELERVWKELLILQICKQRAGLRFVYGLLLEKVHDTEDAYRRVGIVELACYNLCRVVEGPRTGFVYYQHPTQRSFDGISKAHYKMKEWQKDRWEKRIIKLF